MGVERYMSGRSATGMPRDTDGIFGVDGHEQPVGAVPSAAQAPFPTVPPVSALPVGQPALPNDTPQAQYTSLATSATTSAAAAAAMATSDAENAVGTDQSDSVKERVTATLTQGGSWMWQTLLAHPPLKFGSVAFLATFALLAGMNPPIVRRADRLRRAWRKILVWALTTAVLVAALCWPGTGMRLARLAQGGLRRVTGP